MLIFLKYFNQNPIYNTQTYCQLWNFTQTTTTSTTTTRILPTWKTSTIDNINNEFAYIESSYEYSTNSTAASSRHPPRHIVKTTSRVCYGEGFYDPHHKLPPEPNIALISLILLIGTCTLALLLKKLRLSNFLGSYVYTHITQSYIL